MKIIITLIRVLNYFWTVITNWPRLISSGISIFAVSSSVCIAKSGRVEIGKKLILSPNCELMVLGNLNIGKSVFINKYSRIIAHDRIEIGDNVLIAQFVSILDHDHHRELNEEGVTFVGYETAAIKIGSNVLIGDKATILKGSTIGDNVIIGAHALVKGNIPSGAKVLSPIAVYNNL